MREATDASHQGKHTKAPLPSQQEYHTEDAKGGLAATPYTCGPTNHVGHREDGLTIVSEGQDRVPLEHLELTEHCVAQVGVLPQGVPWWHGLQVLSSEVGLRETGTGVARMWQTARATGRHRVSDGGGGHMSWYQLEHARFVACGVGRRK